MNLKGKLTETAIDPQTNDYIAGVIFRLRKDEIQELLKKTDDSMELEFQL